MRVGVVRETAIDEYRVAQVPETVAKLVKLGVQVTVERGAGERASATDADYEKAGATLTDRAQVLAADLVLAVQPPSEAERAQLKPGAVLVCFGVRPEMPAALASANVTLIAMERVPRTTRGQAVDVLSSQALVAGYKAVLLAAGLAPRLLPMMTTAAGTLVPGRVLILGAGVAGLQAIATARRLGAIVSAFDVRAAAKEQVASLGAAFISVDGVEASGAGGYAKEVGESEQARIAATLLKQVPLNDIVITTAQIPGKPAPRLISAQMVGLMKHGSVIIDLAAESGGNCELTKFAQTVMTENGVRIEGPRNLAATMPLHASVLFSKNVLALVQLLIGKDGALTFNFQDELINAMTVTHAGAIRTPERKS
jgi:NAD(P) transhydrogenase subunit alpha